MSSLYSRSAVVGIVAEYNPLHSGHAYHIQATKRLLGNDSAVVCVMSGNVTQRGEPAIVGKHGRAAAAVESGADLVLELPSEYACTSAETFASRAVELLAATGVVSHLSFGSTGNLAALHALAALPTQDEAIKTSMAEGASFPTAYQAFAESVMPEHAQLLRDANNLLGICYLRALPETIVPLTIERIGATHDGGIHGGYASASAIRRLWQRGQAEPYSTSAMAAAFASEKQVGRAPIRLSRNERGVLMTLRALSLNDWRSLPDVTEGLEHRLQRAAAESVSLAALLQAAKSKRYTQARLRRILLCGYLDLTAKRQSTAPQYLRVLAANETGCKLLKTMQQTATLPIITKPADHKALLAFEATVTDALALCRPKTGITGDEWRTSPIFP